MTLFKTIALAALLANPAHAMACTNWKAIAAFDAVIAANDRIAVSDEATHYNDGCQQIELPLPGAQPAWVASR
jgi:hypothetical protein